MGHVVSRGRNRLIPSSQLGFLGRFIAGQRDGYLQGSRDQASHRDHKQNVNLWTGEEPCGCGAPAWKQGLHANPLSIARLLKRFFIGISVIVCNYREPLYVFPVANLGSGRNTLVELPIDQALQPPKAPGDQRSSAWRSDNGIHQLVVRQVLRDLLGIIVHRNSANKIRWG